MTGAMYASIAGLKAHMQKLSVIGNNVANVNTYGYKTQRTVFRDAVYNVYSGGSNGTAVVGGKNPSEIGYGSQIGSIDIDMSSSTLTPGNAMDCAIVGDGFFLVGNKEVAGVIDPLNPESFKSLNLTRVGDFSFKADGYLSDGSDSGSVVYGFMCMGMDGDGTPILSDQLVPIRLPRWEKIYLDANGNEVEIPDGMDKPADGDYATVSHKIRYPIAYVEEGEGGGGAGGGGTGGGDTTTGMAPAVLKDAGWDDALEDSRFEYATLEGIAIDGKSGKITGTVEETGETIVIGFLAMGRVTNPNGVTHEGGSYYSCGPGAGDLRVSMLGGSAKEVYNVTNARLQENGSWIGTKKGLESVNGSLANLVEGQELSDLTSIGSAGGAYLKTGFIEAPNVDLATEISELITTQRGYQANTRIITVTDSMLEELVNMKR